MSSSSDPKIVQINFIEKIANSMNIGVRQVKNTLELLEEGNTVPFIARYRKERTGTLDEVQIRVIEEQYSSLTQLHQEKEKIISRIREQGKLTEKLENAIQSATNLAELHDLYRPYKKKRKTKGQLARDKGLEPLATMIREQETLDESLHKIAGTYINNEIGLNSVEEVLEGARHIIAEDLSNSVDVRDLIRKKFFNTAKFVTKKSILYTMDEEENPNSPKIQEGKKYAQYFEYEEEALETPPHRLLAMVRGEREGILSFKVGFDVDSIISAIEEDMINIAGSEESQQQLKLVIEDSWKRLLGPSMQREIKRTQLEKAELHSVKLFSENLKQLLLTPPIKQRILGIDPAYRTGCKYAAIDETGNVLSTGTIYPHKPQLEVQKAKNTIKEVLRKHEISLVAIGNGTASRETEQLIGDIAKTMGIKYAIVNEAGASVYSASELAREEFPDLDVSIRGAISIARRFQDPLAELVKIDPKSIGVGQYQHDLIGLSAALKDVVVDTVNLVGVNLNTASEALLGYVSGITKTVAKNIMHYRVENGAFVFRSDLEKVSGIGPRTFEQCAGFLRIPGSPEPFDNSPIHPESYYLAEELLKLGNLSKDDLQKHRAKFKEQVKLINPEWAAQQLNQEERFETIRDIIEVLQNPFRDPRDDFETPLLKEEVLSIEDLAIGMEIEGTVTNIVDFGAFVDIGVKNNGLIHISEMSDTRFIKHPREAGLKVGSIIKAKIKEIDLDRKRIGLTLRTQELTSSTRTSTIREVKKRKPISEEDRKMESLRKQGKIQL